MLGARPTGAAPPFPGEQCDLFIETALGVFCGVLPAWSAEIGAPCVRRRSGRCDAVRLGSPREDEGRPDPVNSESPGATAGTTCGPDAGIHGRPGRSHQRRSRPGTNAGERAAWPPVIVGGSPRRRRNDRVRQRWEVETAIASYSFAQRPRVMPMDQSPTLPTRDAAQGAAHPRGASGVPYPPRHSRMGVTKGVGCDAAATDG